MTDPKGKLWESVGLETQYFQFGAGVSEAGSFNVGASQALWGDVSNNEKLVIKDLKYETANDLAEIEFRIKVPQSELSGPKDTAINVRGEWLP